jgi:L-lysine 6-transaminase
MSLTNTSPEKTKWYAQFDWPRVSTPIMQFPVTPENHEELLRKEALSISQIINAFEPNKDDVCAVIIEPIQSGGGDNHIRAEFMERLRELCDEYEAMLIYDEIQTGVGLTGKFWCHEHFGEKARPDIIAFGKKMQICGMLVSKRIDEIENNVFTVSSRINSTWGGSLTDMVRATKILEIISQDKLCANAAYTGSYLQQKLVKISEKYGVINNVRGRGLLTAFDFESGALRNSFMKKGLEKNVLFIGCGDQSIRFRPALIMDTEHIDEGMLIIEDILTKF